MKETRGGFTLAEALIVLAVIGVIAALLVPSLISSTQKKTIGATLARVVYQTELGFQNIIQKANNNSDAISKVDKLALVTIGDIFANDDDVSLLEDFALFTVGATYFGVQALDRNIATTYFDSTDTGFSSDNERVFLMPKQNAYLIYSQPIWEYDANSVDSIFSRLAIDVNGDLLPNRQGLDIFLFGISNNGRLIPAGTQRANNQPPLADVALSEDGCQNGNITDGWSCTARVVKDGFKINY